MTAIWTGPRAEVPWTANHLADHQELVDLLVYAASLRVSDLILQTGRPILAAVDGNLRALSPYALQTSQIERVLRWMTGRDSATASLIAGQDIDTAFNVPDRSETDIHGQPVQRRFRLNATACAHDAGLGFQIVLRYIPSRPPTLTEIGFPDDLRPFIAPREGAVLICGATGHGKTTTYAACLRHILEGHTAITGNILTFESPIEYLLGDIPSPSCSVAQHEIGLHLQSFALAVRNSLRRAPGLVVVGEMRDPDTIRAAIEVVTTGHPLYGTVHAGSAGQVPRRLAMVFPRAEQDQALADILDTTQLIIAQRLVPGLAGGRICLREWLIVDDGLRAEAAGLPAPALTRLLRHRLARGENARSMTDAALEAAARGLITPETARAF